MLPILLGQRVQAECLAGMLAVPPSLGNKPGMALSLADPQSVENAEENDCDLKCVLTGAASTQTLSRIPLMLEAVRFGRMMLNNCEKEQASRMHFWTMLLYAVRRGLIASSVIRQFARLISGPSGRFGGSSA